MVSGLPPGASVDATPQLTWTPAPNQAGTYALQLSASDGVNPPTLKTLILTVVETIVDSDGDGFPDTATPPYPQDNCPSIYNAGTNWVDQNGGAHTGTQPDFDLDGRGDLCDTPEHGGDSPLGTAYVGQVTSAASVTPPANGTAYQVNEPIFVTATVTFQRVDRNGDTVPDKYFAFRPDPFNVFVKVENGGQVVHAHRILEAPAVHIPVDLVEIPGGTDPCPSGMTTVPTGQPAPFNTACAISTVVEVTQSRTDFVAGALTVTPTYFNFNRDPELNATPPVQPEDPALCLTEADGCYANIWLGLAPASPTTVAVSVAPAPPMLAPAVEVTPGTWDLTWEPVASSGRVDVYVGDLPGGFTVSQIQAAQVLLNGTVTPVFTEVLAGRAGFTGPVLHLQYNRSQAMTSLHTLASRQFLPAGDQAPLLLSGLLTAAGAPGPEVALLRATPLVLL
ncbi:MAG: hypothetical protein ACRDRP_26085, partial [Pseudonocardiaceae bacterium]